MNDSATQADRPPAFPLGGKILFFLLWILPFLGILAFIHRYSVDVLYWDEYEPDIAGLAAHFMSGHGVNWGQLMAQHNESRLFFPRLLELAIAWLTHLDVRWQMVCSAVVVLITSAALLWIALHTIRNRGAALATALLVDWLLFTPAQWQNFLWGLQVTIFMPTVALAVMMAVLEADLNIWLAALFAAACAILATYSFANGMMLWVLALPFFLLHTSRRRLPAMALWTLFGAINIIYYFHGYVKPGLQPPLSAVFQQPWLATQFCLAFLGNALRMNDHIQRDICLGSLATAAWAIGIICILRRRDRDLLRRALPWIIFGSYAVFSSMAAAAGRLGLGLDAANPVRYTSSALPLWVSLVPLWVVACQSHPAKKLSENVVAQNSPRSTTPGIPKPLSGFGIPWPIWAMAVAICFCTLKGAEFIQGELGGWVEDRRASRAVIQFSAVVQQDDTIKFLIYPDPQRALAMLAELDAAHVLHCGRFSSNKISDLPGGIAAGWGGTFETIYPIQGQIMVTGWANDPGRESPPDAILLTTPDAAGANRVFAVATDDRRFRKDVAATTHHHWLRFSGWKYSFPASTLPTGTPISAWAYDSFGEKVYRLSESHKVPPTTSPISSR